MLSLVLHLLYLVHLLRQQALALLVPMEASNDVSNRWITAYGNILFISTIMKCVIRVRLFITSATIK